MVRKSISNKSCFLPPWFNERIRYQPTQNPPGDFLRGFFLVCTLWAGHIRNELAKKVDCRKPVPTGVAQFVQSSPINGAFCPKKSTAVNQLLRESQNLSTPLAALIDGQIIGVCGLRTNPQPRLQHWANLGMSVSKKYWRQGVGTALMEAAIRFAKSIKLESITLEVRSDNHAAIALYEKFGFEKYALFPRHFYIRGVCFDAHFMRLQL